MGCRKLQINDYFRMTDSASGTDVAYYALADANKNITEYFDTNGNVVAHYEYSPFGKITVSSGSMKGDFEYRFSSEFRDDETGLVYYNYRFYSAEWGRWMSRDPIAEELFFILFVQDKSEEQKEEFTDERLAPTYLFVGNSPTNKWDDLGLIDSATAAFWQAVIAGNWKAAKCILECAGRYGPKMQAALKAMEKLAKWRKQMSKLNASDLANQIKTYTKTLAEHVAKNGDKVSAETERIRYQLKYLESLKK
jgi:RHS repeat-associated protein